MELMLRLNVSLDKDVAQAIDLFNFNISQIF
jgi:hypothetical protein